MSTAASDTNKWLDLMASLGAVASSSTSTTTAATAAVQSGSSGNNDTTSSLLWSAWTSLSSVATASVSSSTAPTTPLPSTTSCSHDASFFSTWNLIAGFLFQAYCQEQSHYEGSADPATNLVMSLLSTMMNSSNNNNSNNTAATTSTTSTTSTTTSAESKTIMARLFLLLPHMLPLLPNNWQQQTQEWLQVIVKTFATLLAFCLFVLALSLYDFCKAQNQGRFQNSSGPEQYRNAAYQHNQCYYRPQRVVNYYKELEATTVIVDEQNLIHSDKKNSNDDSNDDNNSNDNDNDYNNNNNNNSKSSDNRINNDNMHNQQEELLLLTKRLSLETPGLTEEEEEEEETSQDNNNKDGQNRDDDDDDEDNLLLCLPASAGNHCVSALCIVCLSRFREGERVSWSSSLSQRVQEQQQQQQEEEQKMEQDKSSASTDGTRPPASLAEEEAEPTFVPESPCCTHAFHTDCMVLYAEKGSGGGNRATDNSDNNNANKHVLISCPLCRGPFLTSQSG